MGEETAYCVFVSEYSGQKFEMIMNSMVHGRTSDHANFWDPISKTIAHAHKIRKQTQLC